MALQKIFHGFHVVVGGLFNFLHLVGEFILEVDVEFAQGLAFFSEGVAIELKVFAGVNQPLHFDSYAGADESVSEKNRESSPIWEHNGRRGGKVLYSRVIGLVSKEF
jgi:hypothetical protein